MKQASSLLLFMASVSLSAQAPGNTQWTASAESAGKADQFVVSLKGDIEKGWHVYSLSEPAGGPIPLTIKIEPASSYVLAGEIRGTVPTKHHDTSFDLDTQFYTDTFLLKIPVKASIRGQDGNVPLAVRFQMCSDTTCMPPKTIHVIAKLESNLKQ